ncbi:MAG: aspartate/glutamate racemase family protein [Pseudomonadota bacterium]
MRIAWQSFVDPSQNAAYLERLEVYLNDIADPGTTVKVSGLSPPDRDFGRLTEFRCAILALDNALAAAERGFDAFVMGHFQDPGLYDVRASIDIPVIGAGESTLHWAAQLGRRLALVTIDPIFEVWHLEQAERYGLRERISHIVGMGAVPEDFAAAFAGDTAAFERMVESFCDLAAPLVQDGADVIIPAGVLPGLLLSQKFGLTVDHAPIVSCASVPLKCAEVAVKLKAMSGLGPSRGPSFALAPPQAVTDFRDLVAKGRNDFDRPSE